MRLLLWRRASKAKRRQNIVSVLYYRPPILGRRPEECAY
jgi:hypothetical protein